MSSRGWAGRVFCSGLLAASLAMAAEPEEASVETLRQRLVERLSTQKDEARSDKAGARARGAEPRGRLAAAARPAPSGPAWSYSGEGAPEHWGALKPEYRGCAIGTRQSPIDIRDTIKVDLEPLQFDYRPGGFSVSDNGHTIQVTVAPGNTLQVMGRRYELQQFHFHMPAEERINGQGFDMVAHLVHKDAEGRLAVVAVLLDRFAGEAPQPVLQQVWAGIPLEKHEVLAGSQPLDPSQLLPEDRSYFTYMGSLTTPPCTEGVLWMVMRRPVGLSPGQLAVFARLYPMNARPLQAGSGRLIKESQ